MTDDHPYFCVLPWIHLCATVDGVWGRCCVDATVHHDDQYRSPEGPTGPDAALHDDALGCTSGSRYARHRPDRVLGLADAFNSPNLRATRQAMLTGQPVRACTYCYRREAEGGRSYRQTAPTAVAGRIDVDALVVQTRPDGSVPHLPPFLDLRLGNTCNLRCIMCGYPTSSRWGLDLHPAWAPAHIDPYRDDEELWAELRDHAPQLRRLYLAGGEPLLQPGHGRPLDMLVDVGAADSIDLVYDTNLTVVPPAWLSRLADFRTINVGAWCDGVGPVFERIRVGASWDGFVRNLRTVRAHASRVWLSVAPQRDSVTDLANVVEFARAEGLDVDLTNVVHWPDELALGHLPDDVRRAAADVLRPLWALCRERGDDELASQVAMVAAVARVDVANAAGADALTGPAGEP
jgi:pyruvate-formate lyase-activating enzyme